MTTSQHDVVRANDEHSGSNGKVNGLVHPWGSVRAHVLFHDGQPVRRPASSSSFLPKAVRSIALAGSLSLALTACTQTSTTEVLSSAVEPSSGQNQAAASTTPALSPVAAAQATQQKLIEQQLAFIEEQRAKQLALFEENRQKFEAQVAANAAGGQKAEVEPKAQVLALAARPGSTQDNKRAQAAKQKAKPKTQKASVGSASRAPAGNITLNARWDCVPSKLKNVINEVSRRYGKVTVNSTHRSKRHNRRIGGARNSYHLRCQAVDFRVNASGKAVLKYLRAHPHVGGLKRYRSGFFHIDTGPRRTWRG